MKTFLKKISRVIYYLIPREFYYSKVFILLQENLAKETLENFKVFFKKSVLFETVSECRKYAISRAIENDKNNISSYYLEFGVYKGESSNFFSKYVDKLYAFDSFEGLKEDWLGTSASKGSLNLNKQIPKLNSNVKPIVGWIQDTLEPFLTEHKPKIKFVHIDVDTYETTKYILEKIKPYLQDKAIIIFDDFYNFIGWENGEYKALNEVFKKNEFSYKAFAIHSCRAVIEVNN